jgi:hypothetical protein
MTQSLKDADRFSLTQKVTLAVNRCDITTAARSCSRRTC